MDFKALPVHDLHLGKTSLPYLAFVSEIVGQPMRKPALDQLHSLFNRHVVVDGQQQMQMIGHDDKIVQFKLALRNKRTQYINEQLRIALRLQEPASHACSRRYKKRTRGTQNA